MRVLDSGVGLSNATMQQRLTAIRLWYDYLVEEGLRETNPVGRGDTRQARVLVASEIEDHCFYPSPAAIEHFPSLSGPGQRWWKGSPNGRVSRSLRRTRLVIFALPTWQDVVGTFTRSPLLLDTERSSPRSAISI